MKKEFGFLIAAVAFIVSGLVIIFSDMENNVALGGAMSSLGVTFIALFAIKRKKQRNNE